MGTTDQRRGEFGHLVHEQLRSPVLDDYLEIVGTRRQLDVGEDLGQEEVALCVTDQTIKPRKSRCPLCSEVLTGTCSERFEASLSCPARVRLARGEGDNMA